MPEYVRRYTAEMRATLLLPAGITSEASIHYKDEAKTLCEKDKNVDEVYVGKVLPKKMKYNLQGLRKFSLGGDILIMIRTIFASGLAPTKLISPASTSINCGSSSNRYFLRKAPVGVIRQSSATVTFVPILSAPFTIVRNLCILNSFPYLVTLT